MAASNNRNKIQKRMAFRRKIHILKKLINSKSENSCAIVMDAFLYISALTLKLEALKRERMNQMKLADHQLPSMKLNVKKLEKNEIGLSITIETGKDNYLGHILEAFEEMGINVVHARVSCNTHFVMECIVEIGHSSNNVDAQQVDENVLSEVILKAIRSSWVNLASSV